MSHCCQISLQIVLSEVDRYLVRAWLLYLSSFYTREYVYEIHLGLSFSTELIKFEA